MSIWKSILTWVATGLIAAAAFFCNLFGIEPPKLPDCLTTTAVVTTTEAPVKDPVTIAIGRAEIMEIFAATELAFEQLCHLEPSAGGTPSDRTYTGVSLMDILAHYGVDLSEITAAATLTVSTSDNRPVTLSYALFSLDTTMLAWYEDRYNDGNTSEVCRIALLDGLAGLFAQQVTGLTLTYA